MSKRYYSESAEETHKGMEGVHKLGVVHRAGALAAGFRRMFD